LKTQPENALRREAAAFVILTLVLMPLLAVGVVGGYGLVVWTWQMIEGPPGPPTKG
jgi:periplasmic nitrate reductase NapE